MRYWQFLLNIIFPPKCIICKTELEQISLCHECYKKVKFVPVKQVCKYCGVPLETSAEDQLCGRCVLEAPIYDSARAVFKYDKYSKKIIFELKFKDHTEISKYLANIISAKFSEQISCCDIITSVPISRKRLVFRKFNQTSLLAKIIAKKLKLEINNNLLRKKDSDPQTGLSGKKRRSNIIGKIKFEKKYKNLIAGKKVAIIEDVISTGSTIKECAKVLKKNGAEEVHIYSLAINYR